jgi:hypothetical protein
VLGICAALALLAACSKQPEIPEPVDDSSSITPEKTPETPEVPIGKVVDWEKEVDNPLRDGWETEAVAAGAKAQLKALGKIIGSGEIDTPPSLAVSPIAATALHPQLEQMFADETVSVSRLGDGHQTPALAFDPDKHTNFRSEFKIVQVTVTAEGSATRQHISFSWSSSDEVIEQHATWQIDWSRATPPRIRELRVTAFEQTRTKIGSGNALFSDCTEAVLGANLSYREQLLHGLNHWHERIPFRNSLNGLGTPGLALGDVDGDGLDDLYLCQHPSLPNRLYLQNPDGTLRDASEAWGVDWLDDSRCALIVDLDNDGDRDLAVAILGHLVVASNQDNRRFQIELVIPVAESAVSLTAADYDRDGLLDLYVCGYAPETISAEASPTAVGFGSENFVYHDANNSAANQLFHNDTSAASGWKFTDVTDGSGLDINNRRWTLAAAWEDYDNDGDVDLYVANDFGRNNLYRNDSAEGADAKFVDVAAELGVEDSASGMSASWGDYDRDGRIDLYVANMFSAAGNRIIPQSGFKPEIEGDLRGRYQHFARGNTLLRNLGGDGFADVSAVAGVTMGRWAWSSLFADLNNDGWEDLVVANGHITAEGDSGDL